MGWFFPYGATRADIIKERSGTERLWLASDMDGPSVGTDRVIAHTCVGNVLWTVHERFRDATPDDIRGAEERAAALAQLNTAAA